MPDSARTDAADRPAPGARITTSDCGGRISERWGWVIRDTDEAVVIVAPGELFPVCKIEREGRDAWRWADKIVDALNQCEKPPGQ